MFNPFKRTSQGGESGSLASRWPTEKLLLAIIILIVIGVLGKVGVNYGLLPAFDFPRPQGGKWQAVFLTNNQVYFGRLKSHNRDYVRLKDVYYLQVSQDLQPQTPGQTPPLNLIKLGGELHGPEDRMYIPKDKILFWENLKPDAQVVRAIENTRK